jgi:DNA ligase-4
VDEFEELKKQVDREQKEKAMTMEDRKRRNPKRLKRELIIAGEDAKPVEFNGEQSHVFQGLEFCVLSDSPKPYKKTKTQLEVIIKENGGRISQRAVAGTNMVLVADKKVVKVASLIKDGKANIIRPKWVKDCVEQGDSFLLPYETSHLFHATEELSTIAAENTDMYGDSYARDVSVDELREILQDMPKTEDTFDVGYFLEELEDRGKGILDLRGFMFRRCVVYFRPVEGVSGEVVGKLVHYVKYSGGRVVDALNEGVTHVVVVGDEDDAMTAGEVADEVRKKVSSWAKVPRVLREKWISESWAESTLLDEEAYAII